MKLLLAPLFVFSFCFAVNAQQFLIKGNVKGLPESSEVTLNNPNNDEVIARGIVKKGQFSIKGNVTDADTRFLVFHGVNKRMVLFIGNDTIQVSGEEKNIPNISITGSQAHKDYEDFMLYIKPLNDYVEYYRNMAQNVTSSTARDSIMIMLYTAYNIFQVQSDRFIQQNNNSAVSALLIAYAYDTDPGKDILMAQKRLAMLTPKAQNEKYAKSLHQIINKDKIGAIGSEAINFTQNDENGRPVSLSQFKGKYVLIDFWASWCRPCRIENPNVVAAYNRFKNKNFTVLGVSLDKSKENWLQAIKADNLTWTHVSDLQFWNNEVAKMYNVQSIPQNLLIDPNGIIIAKNLRGEDLIEQLEQLIK